MANFRTIIRAAKGQDSKKIFAVETSPGVITEVAMADEHMALWGPAVEAGAWDVEGNVLEQAQAQTDASVRHAQTLTRHLSPQLSTMVKVNSAFLRRAISALETKGAEAVYLDIHEKRICLAYETDQGIYRAAVACIKNGD